MIKKFSKQEKFIYLVSLFPKHALIDYVLVIFYLTKLSIGIDKYLYLDTLLFILIAVFEIPSGYISDKFGKKRILILGKFINLFSMILLLFSNSFLDGVIVIVLLSIGTSLVSGNTQAILFDYYKKKDEMESYKVALSNSSTIFLILSIFLSFLSGIVFKWNINFIIYIDVLMYLLNILITIFFLIEEKIVIKNNIDNKKENLKNLFNINIIMVFIIASLVFVYFRTTYNFYQPIYNEFKIDLKYFGIFPVIFNLIGMITNQIFKIYFIKKVKYDANTLMVIYFSILISSFFILFSKSSFILFFGLICIQQVIRSLQGNIVNIYVNENIPKGTKYRTTYISIYNFISTGLISLILMFSSFLLKIFDMFTMFFLLAIVFSFIVIIFNYYLKKI